jgi:hypothetical protein
MTDSETKEVKRLQHNVTAKADKVKAIKRTKNEIRIKPEGQLNEIRKYHCTNRANFTIFISSASRSPIYHFHFNFQLLFVGSF